MAMMVLGPGVMDIVIVKITKASIYGFPFSKNSLQMQLVYKGHSNLKSLHLQYVFDMLKKKEAEPCLM